MGLLTKEHLAEFVHNEPTEKVIHKTVHGIDFSVIVIRKESKKVFAFPRTERRQDNKIRPLLILWKDGQECFYTWYTLIESELYLIDTEYDDAFLPCLAYHVRRYFVLPLDDYNAEQTDVILKGEYQSHHTKFLDVHSYGSYIFRIYRDVFDGKRRSDVVFDFKWYFYIRLKDYNKAISLLDAYCQRSIYKTEVEGQWLRVYCPNRNYRGFKNEKKDEATQIGDALKGRVDTFEADLDPAARYVIDNHIAVDSNAKKLWYDIETDDSQGGIVVGRDQILSIGAMNNHGEIFYKASANEKELITWFIEVAMDHDVIIGFNSFNFDGEYIKLRAKSPHKMFWSPTYRTVRVGHVDIMRRIIGTYGRHETSTVRSFSLNNLAKVFLGKSKVEHDGRIIDLFHKNRPLLRKYNLGDVELTKELDETLGITDLMLAMCEWTGMFPTSFKPTSNISGVSVSRLLDSFILRKAKELGIHYKTAVWEKDTDESYVGGLVMEPDPGFYNDVYVLDFKSLYPSIIWSWKISPENWKRNTRWKTKDTTTLSAAVLGGRRPEFYKERKAVFPILVEELMADRKQFKRKMGEYPEGSMEYKKYDIMQKMTKELTNALYGQLGQQGNRYYAVELASSITVAGRELIMETKRLLEEKGIKVFYGDTDSVFITNLGDMGIHDAVNYINTSIPKYLNTNFNIDETIVEIEYEKHFGKFIIAGGKNYAGRLSTLNDKPIDKIVYKGLECVKKNTIEITKRLQEEIVESLLRNDYPASYYLMRLNEIHSEFYNTTHKKEELIIRTEIKKDPTAYATKTPHVRVAEQMIKDQKEFWVGMQIPYIVVDRKKKIYVHADDYVSGYDKDDYWLRIYGPLSKILKVCFKEVDWDARYKKKGRARKTKIDPNQGSLFDLTAASETLKQEITQQTTRASRFKVKKTSYSDIGAELDRRSQENSCIYCVCCGRETPPSSGGVCYDCSSNDGLDKAFPGAVHPVKLHNM